MSRPRLVIFAKAPIMGRAKTRLAADIGPVHAKRIYRAMTARVLQNVQHPKWETVLAVTPPRWLGTVPEWQGIEQYAQTSGSLSPRLSEAFSSQSPTVVIGTDSPQITRSDIDRAFTCLRSRGAVFGPADDGGFWLMGLRGPARAGTFADVNCSTETALADVERNISGPVHYLRTLTDVDDAQALAQVRQTLRF